MIHTYRANPLYILLSFVLPSVLVGFLIRIDIVAGVPI